MATMPTVTPSAPFVAPPTGPNPGLAGPGIAPAQSTTPENAVVFNPDQAELRWQDNRWQLLAGPVFLKDFGRYEAEGREVLRTVRELHLTSLTAIGTPRPIMEYWLSNGEAPHGRIAGLRTLSLDPATLTADQLQGHWCVRDGSRILFNFGQQADACRQALAVLKRYGFTEVGYVGQVAPVMLVFLANPPVTAPATLAGYTPPKTSNLPNTFSRQNPQTPEAPPQQPGQLPNLSSQPVTQSGNPLRQAGPVTQVGLRLPGTEAADRVAIDQRALQVRRDGNDWKLAVGNHVIANFGPNQADAQLAQAALRYYRVTEQVFVGNPRPVVSYFLSNGQAPHGSSYAFNAVAFRPETLSVRQLGSNYVLQDGTQVILSLGDRTAEAQQTLQAIQQYRFDRLSIIGSGDQSMLLFVRTN
jgi:hypothetical protein